jgi:hypothetical protein
VLVAQNNGLHLWAGIKGMSLYVACEDAGEGNDHFILVARQPGALRPAMWAKAGQVAQWDAFLADENGNDFEGWTDAAGANGAATGLNGGVLEGTLSLAVEFGAAGIPSVVYLAMAPYATSDAGVLAHGSQVPASVDSDGNLNANEYVAVSLCMLSGSYPSVELDADCDVDVDDLELFAACMNGANRPPAESCPGGVDADFDNDLDVDQTDFAALQQCLGGSGTPAPGGC